jgi:hypothetical protein
MAPETIEQTFAAMRRSVAQTPEHDALRRLLGEWDGEGECYDFPGRTMQVVGRTVNIGILGSHFVEPRTYFRGEEQSRTPYGFDPNEGRFVAFAINAGSVECHLEYGH